LVRLRVVCCAPRDIRFPPLKLFSYVVKRFGVKLHYWAMDL